MSEIMVSAHVLVSTAADGGVKISELDGACCLGEAFICAADLDALLAALQRLRAEQQHEGVTDDGGGDDV